MSHIRNRDKLIFLHPITGIHVNNDILTIFFGEKALDVKCENANYAADYHDTFLRGKKSINPCYRCYWNFEGKEENGEEKDPQNEVNYIIGDEVSVIKVSLATKELTHTFSSTQEYREWFERFSF